MDRLQQLSAETELQASAPQLAPLQVLQHAGRLQHFLHTWESITHDPIVLQYVTGYKIPFSRPVKQNQVLTEPAFSLIEIDV